MNRFGQLFLGGWRLAIRIVNGLYPVELGMRDLKGKARLKR
jgi:hypothetical protein